MDHSRLLLALTVTLLSGCAQDMDAGKINFSNQPTRSLIMMKMEPVRVPYLLVLVRYNEAEQAIDAVPQGGTLGGYVLFNSTQLHNTDYAAQVVSPGTYVFMNFTQQYHWAACFSEKTLAFTVRAGEAVYLGDFRPNANLEQLENLVRASHEATATQNTLFQYFDGVFPPQISDPTRDTKDFHAAKDYEAASMPTLQNRLQPAQYRSAKFGIGHSLFGSRDCGGFFKEKINSEKVQKVSPQ